MKINVEEMAGFTVRSVSFLSVRRSNLSFYLAQISDCVIKFTSPSSLVILLQAYLLLHPQVGNPLNYGRRYLRNGCQIVGFEEEVHNEMSFVDQARTQVRIGYNIFSLPFL